MPRKRQIIQMVVIGVLVGIAAALIAYLVPWLPDRATEEATAIDHVFWFATVICLVIFALVASVSIYAGIKFRARPDDPDDGAPIHGHTGLEIVWTAVPAVLVTSIALYSSITLIGLEDIPADHRVVKVTSQQFAWSFTYPELKTTKGELVLERGEPVELDLTSKDVIHSFWVPEFRMKQDAVPGVTTRLVITPDQTGTFDVVCTELCGLGHAGMRARAVVLGREKYERWVEEQKAAS
ncbi:MAG: cytochrome c oxidase subunit II [Actinomycetota bacterium]|nr:cytochrome c oxidase subunit II [Actinomycetota bacterium]